MASAVLPTSAARAFFRWGLASYVAVTVVLLALSMARTDGAVVYALDDPAIHLSLADNLVHHGTWGVEPGHFQSASSAPLWTVLIGAVTLVTPPAADLAALVFNGLGAVAILLLLARSQTALEPSWRRPTDALATAFVSVVVLLLPAATFVGMEHLVHTALVLLAVQTFTAGPSSGPWWRRIVPYVAILLASLTRLETAWVAAAVGVATMAACLPRADGVAVAVDGWRRPLRRVVAFGAASAVPIAAFGVFNRAMGQGWLPNSVVAKSGRLSGEPEGPIVYAALDRLTTDAVLAAVVVICAALAIVGWPQRRRWFVPALVTVLAGLAHVTLAQVGWYDRYEIYLIALGVHACFVAATDLLAPTRDEAGDRARAGDRPQRRSRLAPLLLLLLLLSSTKIQLTESVPDAVDDTFEQRYQAARFLERYYDGEPIATGELGYVSLFHDGPITDLYGLGDYEVLQARRRFGQQPPASYWLELARERGFRVVAAYPRTLLFEYPETWILVATWTIPRSPVTAFQADFQFWATVPEEVAPLITHIEEFSAELPAGVEVRVNELAPLRAAELAAEQPSG